MNILPLSAYPKPAFNSRLSMHGTANVHLPLFDNWQSKILWLKSKKFSWVKLLMNPNLDNWGIVDYALNQGLGVIVRLYRDRPNPNSLTGEQLTALDRIRGRYNGKPVYFETNNEPDLVEEWQNGVIPSNWLDIVAINALKDAKNLQDRGLIPIIAAVATGSPRFYEYRVIPRMLALMSTVNNGYNPFDGKLIGFGVHDYGSNHPTGDLPFESAPYPYDDINQNGRPLMDNEFFSYGDVWQAWGTDNQNAINAERMNHKNTGQKLMDYGAALSVLSYQYQYNININGVLPAAIPVFSTEGGVTTLTRDDGRYPKTNPELRVKRYKVIASRLFNKGLTNNYPNYYFCHSSWLSDGTGSVWAKDGWLNGDAVKEPVYNEFFDYCASNAVNMNDFINSGETPVPNPNPNPEPETEVREIIGFPTGYEWSITDATVADGQEYWFAKKVEYIDVGASGGRHHIEIMQPHDATKTVRIFNRTTNRNFDLPLDKPANEPSQNFAMYPDNYHDVYMLGLPSDKINNLYMPVHQHISIQITFEKRVKMNTERPDSRLAERFRSVRNQDNRSNTIPVDGIVVHATTGRFNSDDAAFSACYSHWDRTDLPDNLRSSAHYIIGKSGRIVQCVKENRRAWHAGMSDYLGRQNWNWFSIGIELVNANDGVDPYTVAQIQSLFALIADIRTRHNIKKQFLVGHGEISLSGKTDPKGINMNNVRDMAFAVGNTPPIDDMKRLAVAQFPINFDSALMKVAYKQHGFLPNGDEQRIEKDSVLWIFQRFEKKVNNVVEKRVYFVEKDKWDNVQFAAL